SGFVRGVTCKMMPTEISVSCGFATPTVDCVTPVMRGTSEPTLTYANWLSRVCTCGRLMTCKRDDSSKARKRTLTESLLAESNKPPKPSVGSVRPVARFERTCVATLLRVASEEVEFWFGTVEVLKV